MNLSKCAQALCQKDDEGREMDIAQASEAVAFVMEAVAREWRDNPGELIARLRAMNKSEEEGG